ncbi:MAG: M1 family metallopeptidase, partial [candidate division Zixibacteria bacterium]|nr:M1 family metallopeptidase [candidate division Zixibacteria bacterium]
MMLLKVAIILFVSFLLFFNASAFDTLKVSAVLDTTLKQVSGVVEYKLPENKKLSSFEFQLFPNVYSSADSPYLDGKAGLREHLTTSKNWGSMIIDSILIDDKNIGTDYSVEYTKGVVALEESEKNNSAEIKL